MSDVVGQIDTFDKLVDSIAHWLVRPNDTKLRVRIPEFIKLAEQDIANAGPMRALEKRATAQMTEQFEWLPSDVVKINEVFFLGTDKVLRQPMRYMPQAEIAARYGQATGSPVAWTAIGDYLQFAPRPMIADPATAPWFEVVYYARMIPLGPTNQTNTVLLRHSDVYLYGSLLKSAPYLVADQRVPVWQNMYSAALAAASTATTEGNRGAVSLRSANRFRTHRRR